MALPPCHLQMINLKYSAPTYWLMRQLSLKKVLVSTQSSKLLPLCLARIKLQWFTALIFLIQNARISKDKTKWKPALFRHIRSLQAGSVGELMQLSSMVWQFLCRCHFCLEDGFRLITISQQLLACLGSTSLKRFRHLLMKAVI